MAIELQPVNPREAIEYFRSKGLAPTDQRFSYLDLWREEHARNFVVAKAMRDDVVIAIRDELDKALTEGLPLARFQERLAPRLQEMGWWGERIERDPLTGELMPVKLGSMRRLRTIFETNMRTAHAAGHWARIQRTKKAFPYLQYIQIERPSKRHDHERFHDKIWHVDDPIWLIIYPPNGYFCGCTVIQRTEGWMKRNNRTVSPPLELDPVSWTNKRSGEVFDVPKGVTPGFDANPGAAWLDLRESFARVTPDLNHERRATEVGILQGLQLRRLGDAREGLVVIGDTGNVAMMAFAAPETPGTVVLPDIAAPKFASYIHSHVTEATLSEQDIGLMFEQAGHSITAVTPGGSIWRAVRQPNVYLPKLLAEFAARFPQFRDELVQTGHAAEIYFHARMLWLEKRGAVTYTWHMSEKVRQLMDAQADLVQRLINADT